ncbi:glycosyltransferase family 39 protein [Hymenobacter sp. 5516J-16]|uniref:glycosyltransferase family 39 protein n=1 Tax=Hymenobacter sp. 5516J-16 TaxID=2932253 RepID=UPI001FD3F5C8|nr:glycosyltransferase family 39 protein [Hymenobacter sp. 5516J-16]UOQ77046.1 glycosyltransferase family 39 protein [Hymenobacter sp. 5516J-16]
MLRNAFRPYHVYFLSFTWLFVQLILFSRYGVKIVFDSHRYIQHATEMAVQHHLVWDRNILYIGYTALLALFLKLQLPFEAVVVFQSLLSGVAACCLYALAQRLTGRWQAAFTATLAYVAWPDLQAWNFYIHTDALFCSILTIYTYVLLKAQKVRQLLLAAPLLGWLLFLRPNGIVIGVATFFYLLFLLKHYSQSIFRRVAVGASVVFILLAGFSFNRILHNIFSLISIYQGGSLFGGHPFGAVTSSAPLYIPAATAPLWQQLLLFIGHNPFYFTKLFVLKFIVFFAQIKPYYSAIHNISIILFIYPAYLLAWLGIKKTILSQPQRLFFLIVIGLQATIAAATLPDWDNRFIVPLLPGIFLLAAIGIPVGRQLGVPSSVRPAQVSQGKP